MSPPPDTAVAGTLGTYTLTEVLTGVQAICEVVPSGSVATMPRCTMVLVTLNQTTPNVTFANAIKALSCTTGTLVDTIVAIDPAGGAEQYYRPIDLLGPAKAPWTGTRLSVQSDNNAVVYLQLGDRVSNALVINGVNPALHANLVLTFSYQPNRQTVVHPAIGQPSPSIVASDGTRAIYLGSGITPPNPLPMTGFSYFDRQGQLFIYNVPSNAAGYLDVFVITKITVAIGYITTPAGIAGKIVKGALVALSGACGDHHESSSAIFTGPSGVKPGATPVNDVPDALSGQMPANPF